MAANLTSVGVVAITQNLAQFNQGMQTMRRQISLTGANLRSLQGSSVAGALGLTTLASTISMAGRAIRGIGNEILILGFQLTFLTAGPMAAVLKSAIDFQSEVTKMGTMANASAEQMAVISDQILSMSVALGAMPTELAEGAFFILSSGITDTAEAMSILEAAAKGAGLGLGEIKDVAQLVTAAINVWGDTGLTAARATDIFIQAVREGIGEVDELSTSLGRVMGVAREAGLSLEEVTAFIETFTRTGVDTRVAVTSLRSALMAIMKPTSKARDELHKYGITIEEVRQGIVEHGFMQTLMALAVAFQDNAESMGNVIGTARGLSAVYVNTRSLAEDYRQVLVAITGSTGVLEEAWSQYVQTTEFQVNQLKASFSVLAITLGGIFLPGLNALIQTLLPIIDAFKQWSQANSELVLKLGAVLAALTALGPVLIIVGLLISAFGTFVLAIGAVVSALAMLVSGTGAVVAALGAIGAALTLGLIGHFEKVAAELDAQGSSLSEKARTWGMNVIKAFAEGMAAALAAVIRVLIRLGQIIADLLRSFSPPKLLPDLDKWGKAAMESYMAGWLDADIFSVFNEISGIISGYLKSLPTNILPKVNIVPMIMDMKLALAELLTEIQNTGRATEEAIQAVLGSIGLQNQAIEDYIRTLIDLAVANEELERAQENLLRINERFAALLRPIDDELEAIANRRQDIADAMRVAELEAIVADPRAPALAKELALMELREIALKQQRREIEGQQETEVEAAEERISAAQENIAALEEQRDLLKAYIDAQIENNNLITEQLDLLDSLKEKLDKVAAAAGAAEEEVEELGDELEKLGDIDFGELLDELDDVGLSFEEIGANLTATFGRTLDEGGLLDQAVEEFNAFKTSIEEITTEIAGYFTTAFDPLFGEGGSLEQLKTVWTDVVENADPFLGMLTFINENLIETTPKLDDLWQVLTDIGGIDWGVLDPLMELVSWSEPVPWAPWLLSVIEAINDTFGTNIQIAGTSFGEIATAIISMANAVGVFNTMVNAITNLIPLLKGDFGSGLWENLAGFWENVLPPAADAFIKKLIGADPNLSILPATEEAAGGVNTLADEALPALDTALGTTGTSIDTLIAGTQEPFTTWGTEMAVVSETMATAIVEDMNLANVDGVAEMDTLATDSIAALDEIPTYLQENPDLLKTEVVLQVQRAAGWMNTTGVSMFQTAGSLMGQGLVNGLRAALAPLVAEIRQLIQDLIEAAKQAGEMTSPSKAMYRLGQWFMEGFLLGIMSLEETAMSYMDYLGSAMADTVADGLSDGAGNGDRSSDADLLGRWAEYISSLPHIPSFEEWYEDTWLPGHPGDNPRPYPGTEAHEAYKREFPFGMKWFGSPFTPDEIWRLMQLIEGLGMGGSGPPYTPPPNVPTMPAYPPPSAPQNRPGAQFGDTHITNGMDESAFKLMVRREMRNAL